MQLENDVRDDLLLVGEKCSSVVCCRVSPIQKAMVVKLVKDNRSVCVICVMKEWDIYLYYM